jgi:hypothetical protein
MAVTVYIIVDLEHPRLGLIRVDAFDQVLVDLRNSMSRVMPLCPDSYYADSSALDIP